MDRTHCDYLGRNKCLSRHGIAGCTGRVVYRRRRIIWFDDVRLWSGMFRIKETVEWWNAEIRKDHIRRNSMKNSEETRAAEQ
mmetsp:Transcript_13020/g.22373  ORF Transcript_13020/g.22373 Transcript_13020/m.22373 type:complete len:82 (+) Transcript_13020:506-751(+)